MSDEAKRMSADELAAAKALTDAATPGPWETWSNEAYRHVAPTAGEGMSIVSDALWAFTEADAAFIAAARQLVPALLAHIAAVEAENAALREALLGYADTFHCEIHPGETAYELRVSPEVRDAAITVLMPLFKRPPAADQSRERDRTHG
jgi:hypothetical protein